MDDKNQNAVSPDSAKQVIDDVAKQWQQAAANDISFPLRHRSWWTLVEEINSIRHLVDLREPLPYESSRRYIKRLINPLKKLLVTLVRPFVGVFLAKQSHMNRHSVTMFYRLAAMERRIRELEASLAAMKDSIAADSPDPAAASPQMVDQIQTQPQVPKGTLTTAAVGNPHC